MSNTEDDSSDSLQIQVSEASTSQDRTFTVGILPAARFLFGVLAMARLNSTAAMIVKNGEVYFSAIGRTLSAYGTFLMLDTSTAASWTSSSFALSFEPSNWKTLLAASLDRQNIESFWIYKIAGSPDLYCLVGDDSEPIKLGEANFVEHRGIDMRPLRKDKITINLNRECFREVVLNLAKKFYHAMMTVKSDSIRWYNQSGEFIHTEENGDCTIEGVGQGEIWYLLIEWRDPRFLYHASRLAEEVQIFYLVDPDWWDWSLFVFRVSEITSFWYMCRGSDSPLLFGF